MSDLFEYFSIRAVINAFSHAVEEKTGRPFSTFKWPSSLIYYHLINNRAAIYYETRKANKLEGNFEDYSEVLPCVEMVKVDIVECPCAPKSGCYFMKSAEPLPGFIQGSPTVVTSLTSMRKYSFVEWSSFAQKINSRFESTNKELFFTTKSIKEKRHLYTYIADDTEAISVQVAGIPIDPIEMFLYPVCGEKKKDLCNILDLKFTIEKRLATGLFDMTYNSLIARNNGTQIGDNTNNDINDNTTRR